MLRERVSVPDATAFEPVEIWPGKAEMRRLQDLLGRAKRPIALIGGSRWTEQAQRCAMMRLPSDLRLPVATTFRRGHLIRCVASLLCR